MVDRTGLRPHAPSSGSSRRRTRSSPRKEAAKATAFLPQLRNWDCEQALHDVTCVKTDPAGWRLYMSGQQGAYLPALHILGISVVVNCCDRIHCAFSQQLAGYYVARNFPDTPQTVLSDHLPRIFRFLDAAREKGQPALVHCMAGASRSAAVVIAYLMHRMHMDFPDAYYAVKGARPRIKLNAGFMKQLATLPNGGRWVLDETGGRSGGRP